MFFKCETSIGRRVASERRCRVRRRAPGRRGAKNAHGASAVVARVLQRRPTAVVHAPSVALTTKAGEAAAEREANALTRPDSDNYLVARSSENVEQLEKRGVPLSTCLHGARAVNRWLIPASMDRETSGGNSPVTLSNMNPDMRNCPRVATARVSTR